MPKPKKRQPLGAAHGAFPLWLPLTWLLVTGYAAAVFAEEPPTVTLDVALLQEAPPDLGPSDFEVLIGDRQAPVQELISRPRRRLLLYFDGALSSRSSWQRAAAMLAAQASRLTELGEVEVVRADPVPIRILGPSRDATAVEAALGQVALSSAEAEDLRQVRQRNYGRLQTARRAGSGDLAERVREAVEEEASLLLRQQDQLISYLAGLGPAKMQGVLFWITDGFDLDPYAFYLEDLSDTAESASRGQLPPSPLPAAVEELGQTLASLQWASIAVAPTEEEPETQPGLSEFERFKDSAGGGSSGPAPQGPFLSTTLEGIRRKLARGGETAEPEGPLLLSPRAPLDQLAEGTAGNVVAGAPELSSFLDSLGRRLQLRLALPPAENQEVTVRSRRREVQLRAPRWTGSTLPTAVSAARVRRLLAGDLEGGSVDLAAVLVRNAEGSDEARLEARADLGLRPELQEGASDPGEARLRITVAPGDRLGPLSLSHHYESVAESREPWSYGTGLTLPVEADRVVLVVEDLVTGSWGAALAALVEEAETASGEDGSSLERALAEAEFLPQLRALRLVRPQREVLQGRVLFQARALREEVAEVAFFLDGEEVARRSQPPFDAKVQLGRLPRPRTLRAVAYGSDGREVGEDTLFLNEAGGTFRVQIVSPEGGAVTGAVDVEVKATVPQDRRLDRMEISLNERTVATLYAPPFRQRVVIPPSRPGGFIRAVAFLDDGRFAEDVVFLEDQDFTEKVQVRLVELYTVVTDRQGRPVKGLGQDRFAILEEGRPQEIAQFSEAGDLPLALGLNIDSSASMFVKLPVVQQAASDFVRGFLSGRDRAFLVDFDTQPRLARGLTGDLQSVVNGIHRLRAGGDSHLWESIVFSLVELQGVTGKKALVVFSDGAQEEESLSFKVCHEYAQRLGVPIYLIVLHPGIARGDDLTSSMKSFTRKLEKLAEDTGGRVYYLANTKTLDTIYSEIDEELRSQYLLAYYAETSEDELWRPVKVEVEGRGLKARTITGYFPHL
ncbi:MAG: VWA domain-containing protein [Acidobacteria bacterium]|nr:VWA domain-containing protein [Acidobacteriota bacterium]